MILVRNKDFTSPFTKEVVVQSVTRAGMKPWQANSFSSEIRDELLGKGIEEINSEQLSELIYNRLSNINSVVAERYKAWSEVRKEKHEPLILLIGGGTGIGTTTISTEVAHRIGIRNVIATDMIREIMRKTVSSKLLPALHSSSYLAFENVSEQVLDKNSPMLSAFKLQAWSVAVGIEAILERAIKEGTPTIIEGIHVVPGFISKKLLDEGNVIQFMLGLKDEKKHMSRFQARSYETKFKRPLEKYTENFGQIREIHNYLCKQAEEHNVTTLDNSDVEETVTQLTNKSLDKVIKQKREEGKLPKSG